MGSGEWRHGLGEEAGQASLGWSQVLRVAPPLLTAGDLKSVLGARMPQALCSSLEGRGRKHSSPPRPGPV